VATERSQTVTTIAGIAIGTMLAASVVVLYMKYTGFDTELSKIHEIMNPTPVQAVMDKLPQVAIIGQKPGPGETTEVYIQVPGVLNMQSVYVLKDNETVISGFILPDIPKGSGVPGGQLELPTGQPSVDPRTPRKNREQVMSMSGQVPDVLRPSDPSSSGQPSVEQPQTQTRQQASSVPAPAAQNNPVPVPAPAPSSVSQTPVPSPSVSRSPSEQPVTAQPATPEVAGPVSQGAEGTTQSSNDKQSPAEADGNYLQVADLFGKAAFRNALSTTLNNNEDLVSVKTVQGEQSQQTAYLNLIKSLPAIKQGEGPRQLYVLFDPNCPVCHRYYDYVKNDVNAGRVTVNWIPVTIFPDRRSSITAGAELLETLDSLGQIAASDTLTGMMTKPGFINELGSRFTDSNVNSGYLEQVVTNTGALVMARAETPLIVFEGTEGQLVVEAGIPQGGYLNTVKSGG